MDKMALLVLPDGAEEMETVITVDMLRRAGINVLMAGLDSLDPVLCSRKMVLVPDKSLDEALLDRPFYDMVILPGGMDGTSRMCKSETVGRLLKVQEKNKRYIAAICAAPLCLVAHGVCVGKRLTSYPSTKPDIPNTYIYVEGERVVVDDYLITSRGPGTAYWFGLKCIEALAGEETASYVEKGMLLTGY